MNYLSIGKIAGTFGTQGEVVLKHALGKKTALKGLETIFIEMKKGEFLPYFLTATRVKNESEIFLRIEGVDTRETALKLNQKAVWLEEKDFNQYVSKEATLSFLGFSIINKDKKGTEENLGEILEVIEQPHQVLCRIDLNGKEALIPIHAETLLKADQRQRKLYLNLPEGLLDLYR
ncbi:ribosome maturation factor RimM [Flavihumibacter petaseus]|uniref:Ribosome maturation factor RimM n=1 Tax=Flavihumibacter petaseus NBRC 106054 TaxID=1220578 RepID=A0A0E9MVC7_9BACT|nr:16S rRNA processing protein RimM [Flavihumibacter petaseus]GAO41534.1 ribosome maturation protein RimM [Flavihumibacter petaseus NBRC 106054]